MSGDHDQNPGPLLALLLEDFRTHGSTVVSPGFWAVAVHRLGNARMRVQNRHVRRPLSLGYRVAHTLVNWGFGIDLPYTVRLGRRVRVWHHGGIVINAYRLGHDVQVRHGCTLGVAHAGDHADDVPHVDDGADLGAHCCILGPVVVGSGAVVGAGAVVVRHVRPGDVVVGVPARSTLRGGAS